MAPTDDNIRPTERSAAEQQASIAPKENSNPTSNVRKAKTVRNRTRNRMTVTKSIRIVYVFFFLWQTQFYCFLLENVLSGQYRSQSPLALRCVCLYV